MDLSTQFEFQPIADETMGRLNDKSAVNLITDVDRRITIRGVGKGDKGTCPPPKFPR